MRRQQMLIKNEEGRPQCRTLSQGQWRQAQVFGLSRCTSARQGLVTALSIYLSSIYLLYLRVLEMYQEDSRRLLAGYVCIYRSPGAPVR